MPARGAELATAAVVAIFAATALAMVLGPHRIGDVFTESDFYGAYGPGARALQHGRLDPARYAVVGPVFEFVLAAVGFVVRDLFLAAQLVSLVAMAASLWLWARIVRTHAGPLAGLATALLLATQAQCFRYAWAATTDALALALQAGALALLLAGRAPRRRAALAGLVAGLAFLTRYSAVSLLPAGVIALLAGWTATEPHERRAAALAFAGGFLAPVLPWVAVSLASGVHMRFMLHHNIAYEVFARANGIPWDVYERTMEPQFPTPFSVLARDPAAVIGRVLFNVGDHLRLDALAVAGAPLALAAVAGVVLGARDGTLARLRGAWLALALAFLALVPAFHSERYSLAILPAWAALGALAVTSRARASAARPAQGAVVGLVLLAALLVPALRTSVRVQRRALSQLPVEARVLGERAKAWTRPGERVYARKPHFAWYAGLEATAFPFVDSLPALADRARRDGVRWLYFSWPEAEMRPELAWLLDTTSAAPGLAVRATSAGNPAVLYEIGPGFGAAPAWAGDPAALAVHRARAMLQVNATDWRSRLVAADDAQQHGRWAEAQPWLEQAVRLVPNAPEVQVMLADNLVHLDRLAEARAAYEAVERMVPGDPRTRAGLGWVALRSGDEAGAAALWRPIVGEVPDRETLERMEQLFAKLHDDAGVAAVRERLRGTGARP